MERWKQIIMAGMAAMGIWLIGGVRAEAAVPINEVTFPDSAVRAHVKVYDKNNDGMLSDEELKTPTRFGTTGDYPAEDRFEPKPGTVVNFKGMENFPNIKELGFGALGYYEENPLSIGYNKNYWNYGGSDLLQCFPYAEKISLATGKSYEDQKVLKQITFSGTSDCLKEIRIDGDYALVIWNLEAKNLQYVEIHANEINGLKNTMGELSSLESLTLTCNKMQHCNLAFAKMPLLKNLTLIGYGNISQKDLEVNGAFPKELSKTKLETLQFYIDMQDYGFLSGLKYLKSLTLYGFPGSPSGKNINLSDRNFSLKGLFSLEELSLITVRYSELDLTPVKKTLKVLYVGADSSQYEGISGVTTNIALKRLDISQMENLEELYGCYTGIEKLITRDASGKSALKKLRKVLLWNTKMKSIRLEDMPALEKLELSGDYSKLNFTKCKKLNDMLLKSNKLKTLDLRKNTMLKNLDIRGAKKVKKLDLSKNRILKYVMIQNMPISDLNLSKNTFLCGLHFNGTSKVKMKKLTLPSLREPKIIMANYRKKYRVDVLDLSRIKKMTTETREKYLNAFQFKNGYKKVILSKKLQKSHKNWFKKKAKKVKAKVVVK